MFPLYDDNPRLGWPWLTAALIALNVLAWVFVQQLGTEHGLASSMCQFGLIPGDLLGTVPVGLRVPLSKTLACVLEGDASWLTLLSSMFMHGGWMHIIGNMWFLWVFGDNVEDVMGPVRYVVFYLASGLAAAFAQIVSDPSSAVPMVGASGAIGGVMGAYARLYPRAQVQTLLFLGFFVTRIRVPALLMLGYWFLIQVLSGLPALGSRDGSVAFWAHVGGFVAGAGLSFVLVDPRRRASQRRLALHGPSGGRWL